MSFRVLVIPEDPTYNGYIVKPLVERMLAEVGRPRARVQVLTNPRLGGYDDALRALRSELPDRYAHFDLWIFLPDGDRARGLKDLEADLGRRRVTLLCCAAVPEIEAWLLAGHRDRLPVSWAEVREASDMKEDIFEPFLMKHGNIQSAGQGREALMRETLRNYRGLLEVCPELKELEARLRQVLAGGGPLTG